MAEVTDLRLWRESSLTWESKKSRVTKAKTQRSEEKTEKSLDRRIGQAQSSHRYGVFDNQYYMVGYAVDGIKLQESAPFDFE